MSCSATPENPCFCKCHLILDEDNNPLTGSTCDNCAKSAPTPTGDIPNIEEPDDTNIKYFNMGYKQGYIDGGYETGSYPPEVKELVAKERFNLLNELATKADKEYTRQEIDNWTFSLGALTHEELLKSKATIKELDTERGNYE